MTTTQPQHPTRPRTGPRRAGFSFTEVLFAVMILGVGFIMVAAIFPVAIRQAQTTTEETTGASIARGGANIFEKVATNSAMPPTGNVVVSANFDGFPVPPGVPTPRDKRNLAEAIQGSAIIGADPRYAWVPFYRRAGDQSDPTTWSPFAQVFMVPVQVRNQSMFNAPPRNYDNGGQAVIVVDFVNGDSVAPGTPDTVFFQNPTDRFIPSEGAFLIIADVIGTGTAVNWNSRVAPEMHGRIYRLGNPVPPADDSQPPDTWELMPGFDYEPVRVDQDGDWKTSAPGRVDGKEFVVDDASELDDYKVFIVGRGINSGNVREGTALDVAAYTTFVNVKQ